MSSTSTDTIPTARTFAPTKQRRLWRSLMLAVEVLMLGIAGWLATWNDSHALINGGGFAALTMFLICITAPPMFERIGIKPWSLDYRSLFGSKHLEIRDVVHLSVEFFKGSRILTVKTHRIVVSITDQSVSRQELDELADFIYAGAEATGNVRLKRPVSQRKFADLSKSK